MLRTIESPTLDIMGRAYSTYQKTMTDMNKLNDHRIKLEKDRKESEAQHKKDKADLELAKLNGSIKKNQIIVQEAMLKEYRNQEKKKQEVQSKEIEDINDGYIDKANTLTAIGTTLFGQYQGVMMERASGSRNTPEAEEEIPQQKQQGSLGNWSSSTPNRMSKLGKESDYRESRLVPQANGSFKREKAPKDTSRNISVADKALGKLKSSRSTNREELLEMAGDSLGLNWEQKFPEALEIIGKKAGPDVESFKDNMRKKGFMDYRNMIQYLVENGMEKSVATAWVKKNIPAKKQ